MMPVDPAVLQSKPCVAFSVGFDSKAPACSMNQEFGRTWMRPPPGHRIERQIDVLAQAAHVSAHGLVHEIAVKRRGGKIVATHGAARADVHDVVPKRLFDRQLHQSGKFAAAEDLLHVEDVSDVVIREAPAVAIIERDVQLGALPLRDLAEVDVEPDRLVVGVGHALPHSARDIAREVHDIVPPEIESLIVQTRPRAAPAAGHRLLLRPVPQPRRRFVCGGPTGKRQRHDGRPGAPTSRA